MREFRLLFNFQCLRTFTLFLSLSSWRIGSGMNRPAQPRASDPAARSIRTPCYSRENPRLGVLFGDVNVRGFSPSVASGLPAGSPFLFQTPRPTKFSPKNGLSLLRESLQPLITICRM